MPDPKDVPEDIPAFEPSPLNDTTEYDYVEKGDSD